jgi:flagellar L-ring protein precursor FlgH
MRQAAGEKKTEKQEKAEAEPEPDVAAQAGAVAPTNRAPAAQEADFAVKSVPTRVIERLVDGNYRVRGTQPFMIGGREYRVSVTGIVRAEDFNDEGISSTQLLDPKFDIVSARGAETR